jgi:hypothetical protein
MNTGEVATLGISVRTKRDNSRIVGDPEVIRPAMAESRHRAWSPTE